MVAGVKAGVSDTSNAELFTPPPMVAGVKAGVSDTCKHGLRVSNRVKGSSPNIDLKR
jgi:hypothetical protein